MVSDEAIGSPIVTHPTDLIVMNAPSLDKFEDSVVPGGRIFVDSALISRKVKRTDVDVTYIPATQLAMENNMQKMANMIILGKFIEKTGFCSDEMVQAVIEKNTPKSKPELLELNRKALSIGQNY